MKTEEQSKVKLASAQAALELRQPDPLRKRAKPVRNTAPFERLEAAAAKLGVVGHQQLLDFAEQRLGYGRSALYGWEQSKKVPLCVTLLAEQLVQAAASAPDRLAEDEVVMLVRIRGQANRTMLAALAKGLGLEWVVV